ncbi:unnamed protein product, partial [Brachionus calyciflorus]
CKFTKDCTPYEDYLLVNPSSQLMITGSCDSGCDLIKSIEYEFRIYKKWILSEKELQEKWILYEFRDQVSVGTGSKSNELTIFKSLFQNNPNDQFKVEFVVKTVSIRTGISLGSGSLILAVNSPPQNGSCQITPLSGISASTLFKIECNDWDDNDGYIERYEYFINYLKNPKNITLGFSTNGNFETFLPEGPSYDSGKINVFVRIIDNLNSFTIFNLKSVVVKMNQSNSLQLIDEILTDSKSSSVNRRLHESNSVESLKNLITMAITLNELSLIDKRSLIEASNNSNLFLTTFGPKTNVSFDLIFNDLNSVQPNYLALKIINITSVEYESKRNLRSSIREKLIGFIVNISIFDVTSIKFQSAFLAEITADCSELTRQASVSRKNNLNTPREKISC